MTPLVHLARLLLTSRSPAHRQASPGDTAQGVPTIRPTASVLLLGGLVISRFLERVLLLIAALRFAGAELREGALLSLAVAALSTSRGLLRSPLLGQIRRQFAREMALAVFLPEPPSPRDAAAPPAPRPREALLLDGLWATELAVGTYLPSVFADGAAAIVVVSLAATSAHVSPSLLAIAGALFVVVLGLAEALRRVAGRATETSYQAFLPFASWLGEAVQGAEELRANGREHAVGRGLVERADRWAQSAVKADWLAGFAGRVPFAVGFVGLLLALLLEQRSAGVPDGKAIADALVAVSVLPPFAAVAASVVGLLQETPKARVLAELLRRAAPPPLAETAAADAPPLIKASNLTFRYPGATRAALSLPALRWSNGALLGIAGPNGAGKSTLLRLLAGALSPSPASGASLSGELTFDERPLVSLDRSALASVTAYVAQRPYFPAGVSVREAFGWFVDPPNGEAQAHQEAVWQRALDDVALLARLTETRPDDPLGVGVDDLSGGERKRLALARAKAVAPKLAFFDEPDSSLDAEGLALLPSYLRSLAASGTMVAFVAHRPEILEVADQIVRLDRPPRDNATGGSP